MAVGTPRMEREQRAQHAEPDEDQREPDILLRQVKKFEEENV